MSTVLKKQYRNVSGHVIGVVTVDHKGERNGTPLDVNETVWLSKDERVATARAPRNPKDNPFANGSLELVGEEERETDVTDRPYGEEGETPAEGDAAPQEGQDAPSEPAPPAPPITDPAHEADLPGGDTDTSETAAVEDEETGAIPQADGEPPTGEFAQNEEVGTPGVIQEGSLGGEAAADLSPASKPAPPAGVKQ